ncbi:hypothetical protein C8R47DRAFT_1216268 [Mycena vitilis]|nr:hypothetical protein C8R47DRAFT_1216268 [Mycena vitilis]
MPPPSSHLVPPGFNASAVISTTTQNNASTSSFPNPSRSRKALVSGNSSMQNSIDHLVARVDKLERAGQKAGQVFAELPQLYDRVEDLTLKVEELESALLAATSNQILSDKDQQIVVRTRDNNINVHFFPQFFDLPDRLTTSEQSMLRAVMYSLMGISDQDTSVLPDPVFKESDPSKSDFWVPTGIPDELALRPNFAVSWTKNKPWHQKFVAKVRGDGNTLYPSCSKEVIAGLTDKDVLQRGSRTTFKHLKEKYLTQGKTSVERKIDLQMKRRDGRRKMKAAARSDVRDQYPELQDARYNFVFHPACQSTDCSTDVTSDSNGSDSLDEDSGPKIKKLKSWPPDHRDTGGKDRRIQCHTNCCVDDLAADPTASKFGCVELCPRCDSEYVKLVDDIDARAKAFAAQTKKSKKKSTPGYVVVRAQTKKRQTDSIPRNEDAPKLISSFIDEDWLKAQPFSRRRVMQQFVFGSDDEGYASDWEVFPTWERFDKKGKGKEKKKCECSNLREPCNANNILRRDLAHRIS